MAERREKGQGVEGVRFRIESLVGKLECHGFLQTMPGHKHPQFFSRKSVP